MARIGARYVHIIWVPLIDIQQLKTNTDTNEHLIDIQKLKTKQSKKPQSKQVNNGQSLVSLELF